MRIKDGQAGASDSSDNVVDFPGGAAESARGSRAVERINQYDFYDLAKRLRGLDGLDGETDLDSAFWTVYGLQTTLDSLLQGRPLELGVSRNFAVSLRDIINKLIAEHFTQVGESGAPEWRFPVKDDPQVPEWRWNMAREALANFEMVFAEEMREAATYRVPTRGIYDTRKLVDDADCTFPPDVAQHVPDKAKAEWRASGRCLAFGLFTACGFHVARGVEGMLESYFEHFNGGPNASLKNWGNYLDALEKIAGKGAGPNPKTLGELKQLKDDWRNPLMHPRVVLAEPDARTVFNNGETLIMMMAQELMGAEANGQQELPLQIASAAQVASAAE